MKNLLRSIYILSIILLMGGSLYSQTLTVPPGTINVGPVLIGETSADLTDVFNVTGTGYADEFSEIFCDSYDSRFKISLDGTPGSFYSSVTFNADEDGNVDQDIYVNYSPTSIGQVLTDIELYDFESFTWHTKTLRGIGKGPEMKLEGREQSGDAWEEILNGETTPLLSQGTDFDEAIVSSGTVDRTYQISNTSLGGLSGDLVLTEYETSKYVELTGAHADQFTVTLEPSTPLASGGTTTTFSIQFAPTSYGVKTVVVSIINNDPDENPYEFTIEGLGTVTPPGMPVADGSSGIDNNSFYANWTEGVGGVTDGYFLDVATDNTFLNFVPGFESKDVGSVTTYLVTGLSPRTDYYYRVRAYNIGNVTGNSNTEMLSTAPAVPSAFQATNVGTDAFYANWSFIEGATSYKLDVNTQSDFAGTAIFDNEDVINNYKYVVGLVSGTTYYYRVRSYNGNASENSAVVSVVTLPAAPVATDPSTIDYNQFTANWDPPVGNAPDFYKLDVSIIPTFTTYLVGYENLTVNGLSHVVTGLAENTKYYYRVRAVNVSGVSANSNIINLYTYTSGTSATWTGIISDEWNDPSNWDTGIPGPATDAIIADVTNQPVVMLNSVCNNLNVNPNADLTISDGYSLDVNGDVLLEGTAAGTASLIEYGGLNVTGAEEAEVYLEESRWHFVASPVSSGIANIFYDIYLRYWDETSNDWVYVVDEFAPLSAGQGYSAWSDPVYLGNTTVEYTGGSYNQGPVDIPVTYSGGAGWNLGGNPYPSAIGWDDASWAKTNIDGSVYIWDGTQYQFYNPTLPAPSGNSFQTDGIIPAYQGIFVKTNDVNPALQVNDGARVHGPAPYKNSDPADFIRIEVAGETYNDVMYVHFNENATTGIDSEYDTYKLFGIDEAPQIYSPLGDEMLSVNTLPEISQGLVIPVGFKPGIDGEYFFRVKNMGSFDFPIEIVIEDLETGEQIQMNDNSEFSFEASSENANRFAIHFMKTITGVDNPISSEIDIYSSKQSIFIKNSSGELLNAVVNIFNLTGKEVYNSKLQNSNINRIDLNSPAGYYIVKVITNNEVNSQKVFIK